MGSLTKDNQSHSLQDQCTGAQASNTSRGLRIECWENNPNNLPNYETVKILLASSMGFGIPNSGRDVHRRQLDYVTNEL